MGGVRIRVVVDLRTGREFELEPCAPDRFVVWRKETVIGHVFRFTSDSEWGFRASDGRYAGSYGSASDAAICGSDRLGLGG